MKSKKASIIIALLVLASSFCLALSVLPTCVGGTTLFVGGMGPGNYTTIQDAVNAAKPGDTIYVYNGTYYEHIVVNKTLSLIGEDIRTTIINGSGTGSVMYVTADWVNITGFTITDSGLSAFADAGIKLYHTQNCYIASNNATNNGGGIYLYSSDNNTIVNNTVYLNRWGIHLYYFSDNNTITSNNISDNTYGIWVHYHSSNGTIANNNASSNYDIGIYLGGIQNTTVINNTASNNWEGVTFSSSANNLITSNNASKNRYGITLHYSDNNIIAGNNVSSNGWRVIPYRFFEALLLVMRLLAE
ncbi:MAG: right-handed parallel beta-helix repeat-containing protein, partial [Thermoplasmata archaeon]|nr:right-handed parallel beta-helix repeat-containing protein [Thermoplasmata archaeon]